MKHYIKNKEKKSRKEIVIRKDGKQIINPTEEMILEDGWEEYTTPEPTEEEKLNQARLIKKREVDIRKNSFIIQGKEYTIDTDTLNKMMFRVMAESAMNINKTNLWFGGTQYKFKTKDALELLYQLQIYFGNCFDVSQNHKTNIDNLATQEELKMYDIGVGYPDKVEVE